MEVKYVGVFCLFVQIIDVLSNDIYFEKFFQFGKEQVCWVGYCFGYLFLVEVVEVGYKVWIFCLGLGSCYVFDGILFLEFVVVMESGDIVFGGNVGVCQDSEFFFYVFKWKLKWFQGFNNKLFY